MESADNQHELINSTEFAEQPAEQIAQPVVESVEQTDEENHPTNSEAEKINEPHLEAQQAEQTNPPSQSQDLEQNHIVDETQMLTNQENNVETIIISQETTTINQESIQMDHQIVQETIQINQEILVDTHNKSFNPEEDESKIHELNLIPKSPNSFEILPPPPPAPNIVP